MDGRERWKHAGSCCMGGERKFVTAACECTVADWHGDAFSMPNQPPSSSPAQQDHSLSLSPGDGSESRVGQEVRAVPDLHVADSFLGFCFHKLVGNSLHCLTVTPAGIAVITGDLQG